MRAGLLVAVVGLSACALAVPTPTPPRPPAAVAVQATAVGLPPTPAPLPTVPAKPPAAPPAATDPNRGIRFGPPAVFGTEGMQAVAVLVTNTTDRVKAFFVKATFKNGDRIVATASGAVNDLLPGQTRAATLLGTDPIPPNVVPRIDVDTMLRDEPTTPAAEAARKITFGPPKIEAGAFPRVEVEVTNGDTVPHGLFVQGAFAHGDTPVGVASGAVNDLAPGQTKSASLLVQGAATGHDRLLLAVELVTR